MSEGNGCGSVVVRARFAFQQTNEDELSFSKGDIITVHQQEDGGWWEGTLNGKSGWFPSNYVRELKGNGTHIHSSLRFNSACLIQDMCYLSQAFAKDADTHNFLNSPHSRREYSFKRFRSRY